MNFLQLLKQPNIHKLLNYENFNLNENKTISVFK